MGDGATVIQMAAANCPEGTTFTIAAGVYRLARPIFPKTGQEFVGAGRAATVITGSERVGDAAWTKDDSAERWYANVPVDGGRTDVRCYHVAGDPNPVVSPTCEDIARGDHGKFNQTRGDTFYNDQRLRRVLTLAEVDGNHTFYPDYDADRIYIGVDPVGAKVEVATPIGKAPRAFVGRARAGVAPDNVTIKNMTLTKFGNRMQGEAVIQPTQAASGWTVDNVAVTKNHAVGVGHSPGLRLVNSYILNNGTAGSGGPGTDMTIENNEYAFNNSEIETNLGFSDSGLKVTGSERFTIRDNLVHDNNGNGIWVDICNRFGLIEDNDVRDNAGNGIMWEISYDAVIRDNTVLGNGARKFKSDAPDAYGTNIFISASGSSGDRYPLDPWWITQGFRRSIQVTDNIVDTEVAGGDGNGITLNQEDRLNDCERRPIGKSSDDEQVIVRDVLVHDNIVTMYGAGRTGAWQAGGAGDVFNNNNRFVNNHYYVDCTKGQTRWWHWRGADRTFSDWRTYGHDTEADGGHADCI